MYKILWHVKLRPLFIVALFIILFGTALFVVLEGWNIIDAFYFTVATMMTVGYGDLVPTGNLTKIIGIFYMLVIIPFMLIFMGVVADIVNEKNHRSISRSKRKKH